MGRGKLCSQCSCCRLSLAHRPNQWHVLRVVCAREQLSPRSFSLEWPVLALLLTQLSVLQENLLPRGIAVFWRALKSYRGAGCQWGHHCAQTQRQHPGEA